MSNVIYQGTKQDKATESLPVATALTPGIFVSIVGGEFVGNADGKARLLALSNRQFIDDDIETAYSAGETAIAWEVEANDPFQMRAVTGNYTDQQELMLSAGGLLTAATAGNVVVAHVDGAKNLTSEGFLDVIAADKYTK